jgi:hypothetical protein
LKDTSNAFIRQWNSFSIDDIKNHLLLIDDLYGSCGKCRQLGLSYLKDKICPACKTEFRYLATKMQNPAEISKLLSRIKSENLQFIVIDRADYDHASAKDALGNLFGPPPSNQ